jgi:hypothetical protein
VYTYRAQVEPVTPLAAGALAQFDIKIVDQFDAIVSDFEFGAFGKLVTYAYLAVAPRDLSSLTATPLFLQPASARALLGGNRQGNDAGGMAADQPPSPLAGAGNQPAGNEMGGGMAGGPQPASPLSAGEQLAFNERVVQPQIIFPVEGQYVAFLNARPRGGDEVRLTAPITVGAATTPDANLTPDVTRTQRLGDLSVTLDTVAPLTAGQPATLTFTVTDAAGQSLAPTIDLESGLHIDLFAIDEGLTTFVVGELVDRSNLQFSITFPQPGAYKLWFEFRNEGQQQATFVVAVE